MLIHGIIICSWKGKKQYKGVALKGLIKAIYCIYATEYYADVKKDKVNLWGTFPGHPVVKTPCFHCREYGLDTWLGN